MKKFYFLILMLAVAGASFGQTFPNASFETWSTGSSGGHTIYSPISWYGYDSLVLAEGATFAPLLHFGTPWNGSAQNFQEMTIVHSGASSAKLITLRQDTLGFFPGVLTNAVPQVNTAQLVTILETGTGNPTSALSYTGGTGVTQKIINVSAWVQYYPGIDSTGAHATDTGLMTAEAIGFIGGKDSILGVGTIQILPTGATWVQITDSIVYTDTVNTIDTIRVSFASSGGGAITRDSSTLYVDDVSMIGGPEPVDAVHNVISANGQVTVYPNPATTTLNIDCPANTNLSCQLFSISGQMVMSTPLDAKNELNIGGLASGLYFYAIADHTGNVIQRGKVTVAR